MNWVFTDEMLDQVIVDSVALEARSGEEDLVRYANKYKELLEVVDDAGTILGAAPRGLVHRIGLRHSVVYCAIRDLDAGRMLLQTRGSGRLDITVGGHVQAGETSYEGALKREFAEEVGFVPDPPQLKSVGVYNRDTPLRSNRPLERNRERRHVFSYTLSEVERGKLAQLFDGRKEREEVLSLGWFTAKEVREAVEAGRCADGLAGSISYLLP